jgi:hypothetical protein
MKLHYQADLLRTPADEDNNLMGLWKKMSVGCYMWYILGIVFHESSNAGLIMEDTSSRSRR